MGEVFDFLTGYGHNTNLMKHLGFTLKRVFGLLLPLLFITSGCLQDTPPTPVQKYEVKSTDIIPDGIPGDESDTDKRKRIRARPRRSPGSTVALDVKCTIRGHGIDTSAYTDPGDTLYFEAPVENEWYEYTVTEGPDTVVHRQVYKDTFELVLLDTIP